MVILLIFYLLLQYCQMNIRACLRVHIENNSVWFDYNLRVCKMHSVSPLFYDPYLDIRVHMATFFIHYYYGPYLDPLLSRLHALVDIMDHFSRFLLLLFL